MDTVMAKNSKNARAQAEDMFRRVQKADETPRTVIDEERAARLKMTAGLKAQRLARDMAEGKTEPDRKPRKTKPPV